METYSERTLTAFFRDRADAEEASRELVEAGIAERNIRMVPGKEPDSVAAAEVEKPGGFWEALGDFFFPAGDRDVYAEGLRRGGYLVTVSAVTQEQHDAALDILDDEGTIDVDEWSESWRADGWMPENPGFETTNPAAIARSPQANGVSEEALAAAERDRQFDEAMTRQRDMANGGARVRSYVNGALDDNGSLNRTPRQ
jgi:hypothetical protein